MAPKLYPGYPDRCVVSLSCFLLHSLQIFIFEEAHGTFAEVMKAAFKFLLCTQITVLSSMFANRCPILVSKVSVLLPFPAGTRRVGSF